MFAALNEQLTAADWQFEAEYTEDIVAWSTWATVQHDEQWRGSLILISNPARPESHYVMFRVRQEEAVN
ncbi:MAG: hypothetical protein DCC55_11265 [Chloroflexi bacterium]|nr:MAG: hypothetical protein DCC55_11265 [Chloroflexota bacterium]